MSTAFFDGDSHNALRDISDLSSRQPCWPVENSRGVPVRLCLCRHTSKLLHGYVHVQAPPWICPHPNSSPPDIPVPPLCPASVLWCGARAQGRWLLCQARALSSSRPQTKGQLESAAKLPQAPPLYMYLTELKKSSDNALRHMMRFWGCSVQGQDSDSTTPDDANSEYSPIPFL